VRTVLDADRYAHLVRSPQLAELVGAADTLLDELAPGRHRVDPQADQDWRHRIARVTGRLRAAGLRVRNEADAAGDYAAARAAWEPRLRSLAAATLYRWDEVDPVDRC
jgi:hypothetical protein